MGALFHREHTGEATTVDVSLLSTGLWSMGPALALSLQFQRAAGPPSPPGRPPTTRSCGNYRTKDDRFVALACLQAGQVLARGVRDRRPARAGDRRALRRPRVDHGQRLVAHDLLAEAFAEHTARRVAREARADSPASGPSSRTRWRPPPIRSRWPTATSRTARPPTASRSSWPPRRSSSARSRPSPSGRPSSTSTATRSSRARPRQGRHHRPQGPRRRRLVSASGADGPAGLAQRQLHADQVQRARWHPPELGAVPMSSRFAQCSITLPYSAPATSASAWKPKVLPVGGKARPAGHRVHTR